MKLANRKIRKTKNFGTKTDSKFKLYKELKTYISEDSYEEITNEEREIMDYLDKTNILFVKPSERESTYIT